MDELTPMEPEYRELPPEPPAQIPGYYGTGVQPQHKRRRGGLMLMLLSVLLAANLVTLAISMRLERESSPTSLPEGENLLLAIKEEMLASTESAETAIPVGDGMTLKEIYDLCAPGSVVVTAQTDYGIFCAVGVVLTEDGYLLTDTALVSVQGKLSVTLYDGTSRDAAYVGVDSAGGMAVLKIDAQGLTTAMIDEEVSLRAEQIIEDMRSSARVSMKMNISDLPEQIRQYWGLPEGVFVVSVSADSSAYLAGLRAGDVLLQIGKIEVNNASDYLEALSYYTAGETVRIYLFREGQTYYTDVCLEAAE